MLLNPWREILRDLEYPPKTTSVGEVISNGREADPTITIAKTLADGLVKVADKALPRSRPQLLLAVLVPDGFEADAIEKRIRIRQAIVAAMSSAHYLPDHPKWMNHQSVRFPRKNPSGGKDGDLLDPPTATLVSDQFSPDESLSRSDQAFETEIVEGVTEKVMDEKEEHQTLMRKTSGRYERVHVVYVNTGDLERVFTRKAWEAYEINRKEPIYRPSFEAEVLGVMADWVREQGSLKKREEMARLLKEIPKTEYTGFLWRHTIDELHRQFAVRKRNLAINVIGPGSSDSLMKLLLQKSPADGGEPLRIFSPFASIETEILLRKLAKKTGNSEPAIFGKQKPDAAHENGSDQFPKPWFTRWEPGKTPEWEPGLNGISFDDGAGRMAFLHYSSMDQKADNGAEDNKGSEQPKERSVRPGYGAGHAELVRMTLGDDALARTLVAELKNRNVELSNSRKRIVLISESDTIYGNAFPESFRKQVLEQRNHSTQPDGQNLRGLIDIQQFSYLGGLDGVTSQDPNAAKTARQEKHVDDGNGLEEVAKRMGVGTVALDQSEPGWRPEGSQQYDRIRALAQTLVKRFNGGADEVVAVGVVGSDPYDKLVILQALRPLLPGVIFFTTDLDSNFLTEENLRYTRNLLVASSYGLRLHPDVHGSTMPFRDSYQTAVYHSTLTSLRAYETHSLWKEKYDDLVSFEPTKLEWISSLLPGTESPSRGNPEVFRDLVAMETGGISVTRAGWNPNLYEIGRGGAVSLIPPGKPQAMHANSDPPSRLLAWTLYPVLGVFALFYLGIVAISCRTRRSGANPRSNPDKLHVGRVKNTIFYLAVLVALLAGSLIIDAKENLRVFLFFACTLGIAAFGLRHLAWRRGSYWILITCSFAGMLLIAEVVRYHHDKPGQEPFGLWDGVSAWPSEILRFIGVALAGYYCVLAVREARVSLNKSREILGLRPEGKDAGSVDSDSEGGAPIFSPGGRESWILAPDGKEAWVHPKPSPLLGEILKAIGNDRSEAKFLQRCLDRPVCLIGTTILLFAIGGMFFFFMGQPQKPIRGEAASSVDTIVLSANLLFLYLLTAFAVLSNVFCLYALILPTVRALDRREIKNASDAEIPLQLVETYSAGTSRLPLFPCLVIFILILSRSSALDNWSMPPPIVCAVIYVVGVLILFDSIVSYRARRLKADIEEELGLAVIKERANNPDAVANFDRVKDGVFSTFLSNPVLRAVMIPIGAGGILSLIEILSY